MKAPIWRVWLTAALFVFWTLMAFRLFFVKDDLIMAGLCTVMALYNAKFLYDLTYGWRAKADAGQAQEINAEKSRQDGNA